VLFFLQSHESNSFVILCFVKYVEIMRCSNETPYSPGGVKFSCCLGLCVAFV
jgi:hypothetical protein